MPDNQLAGVGKAGTSIASLADNLFVGKSSWVHLWVYKRGMPFLALLAFYVGRYRISLTTDQLVLPAWFIPFLAIIISCFVVVKIALARKALDQLSGSYVFSFAYMSFGVHWDWLLFSLFADGSTSGFPFLILFWGNIAYTFTGYWAMTWLYCKELVSSEEYVALTLFIAFLYGTDSDPTSIWIFMAALFIPAILLLYRQHKSFRSIVFLASVVTYFWVVSDIAGINYVSLALVFCLGFIWVVFRALKKLSEENVSNLLYSFCLLVISALLYFIFNGLFSFDSTAPLTWWMMWLFFSGVSFLIWKSCGNKILPILALWFSFWFTLTFVFTLLYFADDLGEMISYSGLLMILTGSALYSRTIAIHLNSGRLYIWSRLYMIVGGGAAMLFTAEAGSLPWLWFMFLLCIFATAVWFSLPKELGTELPWWRGVVNPRAIVAIRRIALKSGSWIKSIPFIGATIAAGVKTIALLAHLKKNGERIGSADLLLIAWSITLALVSTFYLEANVGQEMYQDLGLTGDQFYFVCTALITGILLSLMGRFHKEPLFPLLGMLAFIFSPLYLFQVLDELSQPFWMALLISACAVVFVKDVVQLGNNK